VLTFDPSRWRDKWEAYRAGVRLWGRLLKALTRRFGRVEYLQTWEAHQSGWPHVNALIHNPAINAMDWRRFRLILGALAVRAGFGFRVWVEPMRDSEAMAGYMVKLARELTGAGVKNQVPVEAPRHFRRLRASRGLLEQPYKNPDYTGRLVKKPVEQVEAEIKFRETIKKVLDTGSVKRYNLASRGNGNGKSKGPESNPLLPVVQAVDFLEVPGEGLPYGPRAGPGCYSGYPRPRPREGVGVRGAAS
jgi:hypothetical protein